MRLTLFPVALVVAVACHSGGSSASQEPAPDATYTVQFRMWNPNEDLPAEFTLYIDGENLGQMSNRVASTTAQVPEMKAGRHRIELRDISFYRGMSIVDQGKSCESSFTVVSDAPLRIWARYLGSSVVCGVH